MPPPQYSKPSYAYEYLGTVVSDDGSNLEVVSEFAQATATLKKLEPILRDYNIFLGSKVKLLQSLNISLFLYACESWTLTAKLDERTHPFDTVPKAIEHFAQEPFNKIEGSQIDSSSHWRIL